MMSRMDATRIPGDNWHRTGRTARVTAIGIALVLIGVAILAAVLVGRRPEPSGIARVEVVHLDGANTSGSGLPYVIDLVLARDGYPIVMHVDADGLPSILYPFGRPVRLPAGQTLRLPDPHGSATWWAPRGTDPGSLLVAMSFDSPPSTDRLLELAERAASRAPDARSARENVRRVMRDRLGPAVVARLDEGRGG
jgi:hypothetical protein